MEKHSKQRHTCKLCLRRFANGRALGGHMRTHGGGGGGGPRQQHPSPFPSPSPSPSSSSGSGYVLRENPRKSFKVVDPEFSSVVQDANESDAGSYEGLPSYPSSKRPRGDVDAAASSASETTPEEDVARCLVMLSRDVWLQQEEQGGGEEEEQEEEEVEEEEVVVIPRARSRYQCATCKKAFRSYQALGGHRASHNRTRTCAPPAEVRIRREPPAGVQRAHECPFCFKVFASGQALGGHKRSHLVAGHVVPASDRSVISQRLIDLNLPAPLDESESYVEVSALSDAEH